MFAVVYMYLMFRIFTLWFIFDLSLEPLSIEAVRENGVKMENVYSSVNLQQKW